MSLGISSRLPAKCFYKDCPSHQLSPSFDHLVRKGYYVRKSDSKTVARFLCRHCKKSFSQARFSDCFGQKKRKLNPTIFKLLVSGVSQRRISRLLRTSRRTVVRKFKFLAMLARANQERFLQTVKAHPFETVFFDEMESCERSKCLPVSIPLVVSPERKIIGYRVCSMPAKGLLAEISRKKYGFRKDERDEAANSLWNEMTNYLIPRATVVSDENPRYPKWISSHFPKANHETVKGRRGCVAGQGELKKIGFDPLFALNHTAAMLRANINRLFRRTWCVSKLKERLDDHIALYVQFHNGVLTD